MNRNDLPPPIERKKLTKVDFTLFASVIFLVIYAVYQVNDVLVYKWNWGRVTNFVIRFDKDSGTYVANLLLHGLATTLRLAVWGTVMATIIGLVMGYWRTCENLTLRIISRCYVELIRNIPPVVFIFIFFFFISSQIFPALGFDSINQDSPFVDNAIFRIMLGDPVLL